MNRRTHARTQIEKASVPRQVLFGESGSWDFVSTVEIKSGQGGVCDLLKITIASLGCGFPDEGKRTTPSRANSG